MAVVLAVSVAFAQDDDDYSQRLKLDKSKLLKNAKKLSIPQFLVHYKLVTTAKAIGQDRSERTVAGARVTAYLEITDGELTDADFLEITNYGYNYLQRALKASGIDTVAWSAVTATDFYQKAGDDDDEKEKNDSKQEKGSQTWVTSNANNGTILHKGMIGFAFGKGKRAMKFCDDVGASAAYFDITVDFADVQVSVEVKTIPKKDLALGWYYPASTKTKYTWGVNPDMRVGQTDGGMIMFGDRKGGAEIMLIGGRDIPAGVRYIDNISEDASKARSGLAKQFAFRKELTPVVIETTKDKYKMGAKKALEVFADAFVKKVHSFDK